jgi:ribosome-associated translation inhibitor RaiA
MAGMAGQGAAGRAAMPPAENAWKEQPERVTLVDMKVEMGGSLMTPGLMQYAAVGLRTAIGRQAPAVDVAVVRLGVGRNHQGEARARCDVVVRLSCGVHAFHEALAESVYVAIDRATAGIGRIINSVEHRRRDRVSAF